MGNWYTVSSETAADLIEHLHRLALDGLDKGANSYDKHHKPAAALAAQSLSVDTGITVRQWIDAAKFTAAAAQSTASPSVNRPSIRAEGSPVADAPVAQAALKFVRATGWAGVGFSSTTSSIGASLGLTHGPTAYEVEALQSVAAAEAVWRDWENTPAFNPSLARPTVAGTASDPASSDDDNSNQALSQSVPNCDCPLISALIESFESILSEARTLEGIACVTQALTLLASSPDVLVHTYLFPSSSTASDTSASASSKLQWTSLPNALAGLWGEIHRHLALETDSAEVLCEAVRAARESMGASNVRAAPALPGQPAPSASVVASARGLLNSRRQLFESYVVVQEFVAELLGVLAAKAQLGSCLVAY
jgi:hypothetical protein